MSEDDRTATHLRRLGINPVTVARLRQYAEDDEISLGELVRYILNDYAPPLDGQAEGANHASA